MKTLNCFDQEFLRQEVQLLLSYLVKIKIWIQLNIPKVDILGWVRNYQPVHETYSSSHVQVEDGNNFGVSIQVQTMQYDI